MQAFTDVIKSSSVRLVSTHVQERKRLEVLNRSVHGVNVSETHLFAVRLGLPRTYGTDNDDEYDDSEQYIR